MLDTSYFEAERKLLRQSDISYYEIMKTAAVENETVPMYVCTSHRNASKRREMAPIAITT